MDVPAYQIGGVFLLMALFMYGTSVSGFFPKLRGQGKTAAIVIGLAALAVFAIRYAPELMDRAREAWIGKPEAKPALPSPPAAAAKPRTPRAAKPAPQPKMTILPDEVPAAKAEVAEPAQAAEPAKTNPYDSRLKHAAKSVGRFLHVVPRKDP